MQMQTHLRALKKDVLKMIKYTKIWTYKKGDESNPKKF